MRMRCAFLSLGSLADFECRAGHGKFGPGGGHVQVTFVWTLSNFGTFHDQHTNAKGYRNEWQKEHTWNTQKHIGSSKFPPWMRAVQCWYCTFKVSCGFVRSSRTRRDHTNEEKELKMSDYNKIKRDICEQSLTLNFLEIHRQLLANFLGDLVN